MPPDIPGVGATPRLLPSSPIGPTLAPGTAPPGPVGPVVPTNAILPVAPAATRASAPPSSPLGRSGLDLLAVLGTADLLVERSPVAPVALDVGLETARGALLRGLAAESLATLDGVWERAQRTEEGWYLRSGALTVLGLPGEAERVSAEALQLKPSSVAMRFMQSLARLASGDVTGARSAIAAASESTSTHPVLLMQQAIVLARQNHPAEAERLLQQVMREFPEHPAVEFARTALRASAADHTRSTSRSTVGGRVHEHSPFTTGDHEVFEAFRAAAHGGTRDAAVEGERAPHIATSAGLAPPPRRAASDVVDPARSPREGDQAKGNVAERAIVRLGSRLAMLSVTEAVREGRALIRAFSAGGSMTGSCTPEQAHAARGVLTAIVVALNGSVSVALNGSASVARVTESASSLEGLLSQWLPLMQTERFDDAARVLRRLGAGIPDAQRRLLAACAHGPSAAPPRGDRNPVVLALGTGDYEALVQGEPVSGPLIPVRLGLALLEERAPERLPEGQREANRAASGDIDRAVWSRTPTSTRLIELIWAARADETARAMSGWIERPPELTSGGATPTLVTPNGLAIGARDTDGRGWEAVLAAGASTRPPRDEGASARIAALLCVLVAAGAGMSGSGAVAIAFGLGAAWLGLRRSRPPGDRPDGADDRGTSEAN